MPVIAVNEMMGLESMLCLFAAGADDVVRKPVHAREFIARIGAIKRRVCVAPRKSDCGRLKIFFDGRDPEVNGQTLMLPRRERRILEYLAANRTRRVSRSAIFNAVYGLFDDEVEESVVESHISKLRKKLRHALGYDPIDTKRFLGYQLVDPDGEGRVSIATTGLPAAWKNQALPISRWWSCRRRRCRPWPERTARAPAGVQTSAGGRHSVFCKAGAPLSSDRCVAISAKASTDAADCGVCCSAL